LVTDAWITLDTEARTFAKIDWQQALSISPLVLRIAQTDGYIPTFLQHAITVDPLVLEALKLLRGGITKDVLIGEVSRNVKQNKALALEPKQRKPRYVKKRLIAFLLLLESNGLLTNC